MRAYWRFFRRETPLLTYGVSLTFLSSVGQTFLVSLFVPHFLEAFALSEGGFGLLYSGATLGSAALLPWVGGWLDRERLHHFTLGVVGLLAVSAFMASLGMTTGMSGAVQTALWAELYGTRHLGGIKSMLGSMMVVSTAASPPLVGFVLEGGNLEGLLVGGVVSVVVGVLLAVRVLQISPSAG